MKSGIIGLPGSGKTTIFEALTLNFEETGRRGENRIGTVQVPDSRVDVLSEMYAPHKTTYAQVEYFLPGSSHGGHEKDAGKEQVTWTSVRDCDALIHVTRNFSGYGLDPPAPDEDFRKINQELMLDDFLVAEKRLERLALDQKRGKKIDRVEFSLLQQCVESLENNIPLRKSSELATAPQLKGFAFLSAKPLLILFNNEDDNDQLPALEDVTSEEFCQIIRGKLEHELAQMSAEEAGDFLTEFNISASAKDRVISQSYELLGLISFFTVGEDEVRAWTIKKNTRAVEAAGVIHTDMQKGFIRAEVLSYKDLIAAGTYAAARKKGTVRLEGKTYEVRDGDIVHIRFNV